MAIFLHSHFLSIHVSLSSFHIHYLSKLMPRWKIQWHTQLARYRGDLEATKFLLGFSKCAMAIALLKSFHITAKSYVYNVTEFGAMFCDSIMAFR